MEWPRHSPDLSIYVGELKLQVAKQQPRNLKDLEFLSLTCANLETNYKKRLTAMLTNKDSPLPATGPTTGAIIGAIIGVIILIAIIGTVIALYRKRLHGDGPPKYKPPPPKKANKTTNSANMLLKSSHTPMIQNDYYSTQGPEPVTDLDAYHEEDVDEAHYMSAAPSGWDDPEDNEVPPPYMQINSDPQDHDHDHVPNIGRGESFVSPAMFV